MIVNSSDFRYALQQLWITFVERSENVLLYEFKKLGYKIYNPCKQIIIVHEHKSNVRDHGRKRIDKYRHYKKKPTRL